VRFSFLQRLAHHRFHARFCTYSAATDSDLSAGLRTAVLAAFWCGLSPPVGDCQDGFLLHCTLPVLLSFWCRLHHLSALPLRGRQALRHGVHLSDPSGSDSPGRAPDQAVRSVGSKNLRGITGAYYFTVDDQGYVFSYFSGDFYFSRYGKQYKCSPL